MVSSFQKSNHYHHQEFNSLSSATNGARNSQDYEYGPMVMVTSSTASGSKVVGPSILKGGKGIKPGSSSNSSGKQKISAECSPSKQPLIGAELHSNNSVASSLSEETTLPINSVRTAAMKALPLKETPTTKSPMSPCTSPPSFINPPLGGNSQNTVVVAGTLASGRECILTTFGDKTQSAATVPIKKTSGKMSTTPNTASKSSKSKTVVDCTDSVQVASLKSETPSAAPLPKSAAETSNSAVAKAHAESNGAASAPVPARKEGKVSKTQKNTSKVATENAQKFANSTDGIKTTTNKKSPPLKK